ncbi:MAG TPA: septal ring lytic transglycosylase RlpA family protein [Desulfomonilaceae bacterium]|nr:septal ring lytic transglycosylase RlpA family protein [Desulfomonilaceae bacterium]
MKLFLKSIPLVCAVLLMATGCATSVQHAKKDCPKSYTVLGKTYYPLKKAKTGHFQDGVASWYGPGFHGKKTATGEVYDMHLLTAAHNTLPLHSVVKVTNLLNKKEVVVRINDRGPFVGERVVDLSLASAKEIGMVGPGTVPVRLTVLTSGDTIIASRKTPGRTEPKEEIKSPNPFFTGGISKLLALTRN